MAKIKYKDQNFRTDSLYLIRKVTGVLDEYKAQGYVLTLRQVYYQMVSRDIIPNNMRSYKNLGSLINDARLAGLIDWSAIEDRSRSLESNSHWENPKDIILSSAWCYHRDHWEGQEYYVEVWVEKEALINIVQQICSELDVSCFACKGYVSQSEMWAAANRLKDQAFDKDIVLIHLGDHDPSGIDMSRDIRERMEVFGVENLEFHRIALNMDQVDKYNPPPNPAKLTDSRAKGYINKHGQESWELDALEPKVLKQLIKHRVLSYRDEEIYKEVVDTEQEEKKLLDQIANRWGGIEQNWNKILKEIL